MRLSNGLKSACVALAALLCGFARDDVLTCDRHDTRSDAMVYKVGLLWHQHVVRMRDQGNGVPIEIVRIEAGE